jgi:hypothetical protein
VRIEARPWVPAASLAGVAAAAVFLVGLPTPLANIDDYNLLPFGRGYAGALAEAWRADLGIGRFRPLYWVLEGALGAVTGRSAAALHVGRAGALAVAVALTVLVARRLGTGPVAAAALALLVAWSKPALGVWAPGGPAEAFAQPLALGALLALLEWERPWSIPAAASLGLLACLSKESYAAWTAGALGACAGRAALRGEWRRGLAAAAGAALQLAPAAVASGVLGAWRGSYARHVLAETSSSPLQAGAALLRSSPLLTVLGLAGAFGLVAVRVRARPSTWPPCEVVVLGGLAGTAAGTLLTGLTIHRYQLPLVTALALAAARGWGLAVEGPPSARWRAAWGPVRAGAAGLALLCAAGAGTRAYYAVAAEAAGRRADERMRGMIAAALAQRGEVRIVWTAQDVERPLGALKHLAAGGISGRVRLEPCGEVSASMTDTRNPLFEAYPGPVSPAAPAVVSSRCGLFEPYAVEEACTLELPGAAGLLPVLECGGYQEPAALFGP